MSELSQFIIVVDFGPLCFGCWFLVALIVTRNKWRREMIKRGVARYNWQTGKPQTAPGQSGPSKCRMLALSEGTTEGKLLSSHLNRAPTAEESKSSRIHP